MAMSMKDFLLLYFRQLHFNEMPDGVRAQFNDYASKGEFHGDMKSWWDDLVDHEHPKDKKPQPDAEAQLTEDDWKQFYSKLHETFESMAVNQSSFEDNKDAKGFFEEYFGDEQNKLFSLTKVSSEIINKVISLLNVVNTDQELKSVIVSEIGGVKEYNSLIQIITKGAFNEAENKEKIETFVYALMRINREYKNANLNIPGLGNFDFDEIINGLHPKKDVTALDVVKLKSSYRKILDTLHNNQKVADVFKNFDKTDISKQLETAIAKTDYTGKITEKDFVPEKIDDRKTLNQRIKDWGQDKYKNHLKRFATLHRDNLFSTKSAKPIVEAMEAEGIKPTDGLKAFIDKADAIKNRLNSKTPKTADHFDWMIKALKDLSKTDSFAAALRNGQEQRKLIDNLAKKAAIDGKKEEAKVAMEVIHAMSYGLFDSRTMDAVNKMEFNVLNDSNYSWMKNGNEVTKGVANAANGMLKGTIKLVGYTVTAGVNLARRVHTTFRESDKMANWQKDTKLENQKKSIDEQNKYDTEHLRKMEEELYKNPALSDADRKAKLEEFRKLKTELKQVEKELATLDEAQKKQQQLKDKLNNINIELNDPKITDEKKAKLQKEAENTKNDLKNAENEVKKIETRLNGQGINITKKQQLQDKINNLETSLLDPALTPDQAKEKRDVIDFYESSIDQRNDKYEELEGKTKETYDELMAFWKYLHTGHTKQLFGFGTKRVQKRYEEGRAIFHKTFEEWRDKAA